MKNYIQIVVLILFLNVSCKTKIKEDVLKSNKIKVELPLKIKDTVGKKADENFKNNLLDDISKTKNDSIFKIWDGTYSLNFHKERKHSTTMYWQHSFIVEGEICTYEGSGFQFYSKYSCVMKVEANKLLIFAKENIDGYQIYNKDELIIEIEKIDNLYYTKTIDLKPEEALDNPTKYGFEVIKRLQ